jgi:hypothetical protein
MATRMQQRRGTATMWTNANPILGVAEIGYETDTNKFKIGDGTNRWADLTYFVDIDTMIAGAPGLLNSLDEIAAAIGDDPAFFTTVATGLATKAPLASPTFTGTVSGVTKAHVGLGNVDNTTDAAKPVSTATQTALDAKASNTALANHEADTTNIHGIADTSALATKTYADNAASTAVAAVIDSAPGALDTLNELAAALSDDASYATTITNALALKAPLASPTFTGTVSGVTKSHVGLGSVDNTSDANKPVSTATQTELDLKAPIANPTFTGSVSGVTKAMVGLSDVDNTSDTLKPLSDATITALALKAPKESPTFTGTVTLPANTISTVHLSDDSVGTNEIADGAVTNIKLAGSIAQTKVTDLVSDLALKAPLASPALTGTPSSPTASVGTNTTQVATTAFVHAEIRDLVNLDLLLDGGTLA